MKRRQRKKLFQRYRTHALPTLALGRYFFCHRGQDYTASILDKTHYAWKRWNHNPHRKRTIYRTHEREQALDYLGRYNVNDQSWLQTTPTGWP